MKENMIATDKSQSQRLLACGVSADTADMAYCLTYDNLTPIAYNDVIEDGLYTDKDCTPVWSLSALLSLLPESLMSPYGTEYHLELSKLRMHDEWEVQWWDNGCRFKTVDKTSGKFCKLWDASPIEACVKAIEWLAANGYKLNEIKEK